MVDAFDSPCTSEWSVVFVDNDNDAYTENGWVGFRYGSINEYADLECIGAITAHGRSMIRNQLGNNYDTIDLFKDVIARGPAWLAGVFALESDDAGCHDVYFEFNRKFDSAMQLIVCEDENA
jgi:hypothetical protein